MEAAEGLPKRCGGGWFCGDFCKKLCGMGRLDVYEIFMLLLLFFLFWGVVRG